VRTRKGSTAALVLLGLAACLALKSSASMTAAVHPIWREVKWRFPIDQWGTGKAYRCNAADCGTDVDVFLRAKIGFCNCTTGVADDPELERVADFDLFGGQSTALAPGHPIAVRWMKGRSRPYLLSSSLWRTRSAPTIAFNDRCDVIVPTAITGQNRLKKLESIVLGFLNGDTVIRWAELTLGL
jgi:hypothetical protein